MEKYHHREILTTDLEGVALYSCTWCDRIFNSKANLDIHRKKENYKLNSINSIEYHELYMYIRVKELIVKDRNFH